MSPYAQTIVQLQAQLARDGHDDGTRSRIARVHALAVELFSGKHRGSGRPFLAHLVATASILAAHHASLRAIAAGLLHAAYEQGDFGRVGDTPTARDRRELADAAGPQSEALVFAYARTPWNEAAITLAAASAPASDVDRDVRMMRLANELDDHLDLGILYCSDADRRLARLERLAGPAVALARGMEAHALADELASAFDACRAGAVPADLRGAGGSSYLQVPRSCVPRLMTRIRARLLDRR